MNGYRVFIPTAGTGSRLGKRTSFLNKSLLSVAGKPALAHIIGKFPTETEFVIALGYKGDLVREFLSLAYPGRSFLFVDVFPFAGPGSGLGLTLLSCRRLLQQPFVFISCDTLVDEDIPDPSGNWAGYAHQAVSPLYRSLEYADARALHLRDKCEPCTGKAAPYIGLAGVSDYRLFWEAMDLAGDTAIEEGEACAVEQLCNKTTVEAVPFSWHDIGTPEALEEARQTIVSEEQATILEKPNEAIWFVQDKVIKFSDDTSFIQDRVARSAFLQGFIPRLNASTAHMYSYAKAPGRVFSQTVTLPRFLLLLDFLKGFWMQEALTSAQTDVFEKQCLAFYRDKSIARIEQFFQTFQKTDKAETINGVPQTFISDLMEQVDWALLAKGLPGRFHGDLHFENILFHHDTFVLLDWRQNFGASLTTGDIYYDFAKILHGLIINHELVANDQFTVHWSDDAIDFDFLRKQVLVECERVFLTWLRKNGFDTKKVEIMTALIFLNIAALHHSPYSLLLFGLGKSMLTTLHNNSKEIA